MEPFPSLPSILDDSSTIKFLANSDDPDFGELDLSKNPVKTPFGPFVWMLPDRVTEVTLTVVGKVIYSAIGNKSGPYFSLPEARWVCAFLFTHFTIPRH